MSTEYNLCPKCGGVKSLKRPEYNMRVSTGVFRLCSCPKPNVTIAMEKPEQKPVPVDVEMVRSGVKYRGTLYPVEDNTHEQ